MVDSKALQAKAKILKESQLFGVEEDHRQAIFLVLAGLKPVSQATSGHWEDIENGRRRVADKVEDVEALLSSLGLVYSLSETPEGIDAVVSLDQALIDEYLVAVVREDLETIGRLFGYPETAYTAYAQGDYLDSTKDEELRAQPGMYDGGFSFSPGHYQEEVEVLKQWYKVLADYDLVGIGE